MGFGRLRCHLFIFALFGNDSKSVFVAVSYLSTSQQSVRQNSNQGLTCGHSHSHPPVQLMWCTPSATGKGAKMSGRKGIYGVTSLMFWGTGRANVYLPYATVTEKVFLKVTTDPVISTFT